MKLEDFIKNNRGAFDDKEVPGRLWNTIERSLPVKGRATLWNSVVLWRAAAIVFMIVSAGLFMSTIREVKPGGASHSSEVSLNEFKDVEAFYFRQISDKERLIDEYNKLEGLNGFTQDFHQLEAMYLVLREELKKHPSKEVKDALELNLLIRINLLNQQLHNLENEYGDPAEERDEVSGNS